jgi:hypothetical protein
MSVISEMRPLLEEDEALHEWDEALGNLLGFCEETGIDLESENIDGLLSEIDEWVENSDLSEEEIAQLREFAKALKRLAFKGARAVGKVAGAYKRAKGAVKSFGRGVKRSARAGFASGHKRPGAKKRRTIKRPAKPGTKRPGTRPRKPGKPGKRR